MADKRLVASLSIAGIASLLASVEGMKEFDRYLALGETNDTLSLVFKFLVVILGAASFISCLIFLGYWVPVVIGEDSPDESIQAMEEVKQYANKLAVMMFFMQVVSYIIAWAKGNSTENYLELTVVALFSVVATKCLVGKPSGAIQEQDTSIQSQSITAQKIEYSIKTLSKHISLVDSNQELKERLEGIIATIKRLPDNHLNDIQIQFGEMIAEACDGIVKLENNDKNAAVYRVEKLVSSLESILSSKNKEWSIENINKSDRALERLEISSNILKKRNILEPIKIRK